MTLFSSAQLHEMRCRWSQFMWKGRKRASGSKPPESSHETKAGYQISYRAYLVCMDPIKLVSGYYLNRWKTCVTHICSTHWTRWLSQHIFRDLGTWTICTIRTAIRIHLSSWQNMSCPLNELVHPAKPILVPWNKRNNAHSVSASEVFSPLRYNSLSVISHEFNTKPCRPFPDAAILEAYVWNYKISC